MKILIAKALWKVVSSILQSDLEKREQLSLKYETGEVVEVVSSYVAPSGTMNVQEKHLQTNLTE